MHRIGYCTFDYEGFEKWNENYIPKDMTMHSPSWISDNWKTYFYDRQALFKGCTDVFGGSFKSTDIKALKNLVSHLKESGEEMQLFYYDDTACVIGYERQQFIMNPQFVVPKPFTDYNAITMAQMKALGASSINSSLLPSSLSESSIQTLSDGRKKTEKEIEDTQAYIREEEEKIRQEMHRRIEEIKARTQGRLDELNAKLKEYEKEIFILESQVYAIRCYTGEVVSFSLIRDGKSAPQSEPLIVYQKIRFLDEELGKHVSVFDFDGEGDKRLLSLLKARDDIAELFAPGKRSLTILRTSRTGKFVAANATVKNMLDEYEQYHGMQLALLLRDGEKLYIAWCDADNIRINEENAFYSMSKSCEARSEDEDSRINDRATDIHEALSRYYLLSILQGVIDTGDILKFPEKFSIMDYSQKYIVFSLAQGWIPENRYGTFEQMLERSKGIEPKKGDHVLTITWLHPDGSGKAFDNDRGIGSANRTRNASIKGKTIYPVNLVLNDAVVEYTFDAIKIEEVMTKTPVYVTKDAKTTKEMQDDVDYKLTDTILFSGKGTMTISAESLKNVKNNGSLQDIVINSEDAIGNRYGNFRKYYRDERFGETYYSKPDFINRKPLLSGKELYAKRITSVTVKRYEPHVYVSVKQNGYGSYKNGFKETQYFVNFELFSHEYFRTDFLCPSWIEEVIRNASTGHIGRLGAGFSFADLLPYLHVLKEFLDKRKKEDSLLIKRNGGDAILNDPDWDAWLCDWKIENRVHQMGMRSAKKFIKDMEKQHKTAKMQ